MNHKEIVAESFNMVIQNIEAKGFRKDTPAILLNLAANLAATAIINIAIYNRRDKEVLAYDTAMQLKNQVIEIVAINDNKDTRTLDGKKPEDIGL